MSILGQNPSALLSFTHQSDLLKWRDEHPVYLYNVIFDSRKDPIGKVGNFCSNIRRQVVIQKIIAILEFFASLSRKSFLPGYYTFLSFLQ